jgi:hypothetical protein
MESDKMKRFMMVAAVVGILALALSSTAFAQTPVPGTQSGAQFGIHAPGTGLMQPGTGFGPRSGAAAGMGMRGGAPVWAGQPVEVQKLLGLSQEQIQADRLAGKSLTQIAAAKSVNKNTLVSTMLSAKKALLDGQVTAGKLTREQADAVYANMQQQVTVMVDRTNVGPSGNQAGLGAGAAAGARMGGRWNR